MKPKRIVSKDQDLNLVQDALGEWAEGISPLAYEMTLLGPISLKTGSNTVVHRLQRVLIGWMIVRRTSAAVVFDEQTGNKTPEISLKLNSSAVVTVWLLVF